MRPFSFPSSRGTPEMKLFKKDTLVISDPCWLQIVYIVALLSLSSVRSILPERSWNQSELKPLED